MPARVTDLRADSHRAPAWCLENALVSATFDASGAIVRLLDRRTGQDALAGNLRLHPAALGRVRFLAGEPTEDDEPASLQIGGLLPDGFSFLVRYELPTNEARLRTEARLTNRRATRIGQGRLRLCADLGNGSRLLRAEAPAGVAAYCREARAGIAVFGRTADLARAELDGGRFVLVRPTKSFSPRETETWRFDLVPLTGLPSLEAFGACAAISVGERLIVQAHRALPEHRLDLRAADGRTYALPAYLYAEHALTADWSDIPNPSALALVAPDGRPALTWRADAPVSSPIPLGDGLDEPNDLDRRFTDAAREFEGFVRVQDAIERADSAFRHRAAAQTLMAIQATRDGDYAAAEAGFESALLYNAEDALAWWGQAVVQRLQGADDERPSLLNAHFLAPFEPALRAESFLAQPIGEGTGPSPLLRDLADDVPNALEAACAYVELGLFDQAARLLEELLRFADHARLRRLLAACYLEGTRMEAHAAEQVALCGSLDAGELGHPVEEWAARVLAARFG